ncbi:hypothetical protein E6P09_01085 [Haloferax mediterranei ATCC 33500]|uniref:Uncharacterized protein n=1 Tax=Haloferax mediterranei (strain ATCC 33500 / DSM 1411 / JCM 8866 / NBRC 14739 / NCIMB 2177 / R-4) TaxID=523841 RepID=I3R6F2_HALMT|nr:hypothetical protein [Haloferax mediterranei]AFK19812.1 hypothetical protein HFX_2121 [Haloferax mediterranei ATCC 33500]AHZ23196.1 hypothetical protein BM92_11355 [Haloferax mediterranei ATCC 33500]ELZ99774.1 hypothetical protein C439_12399 [Haloferax mediterranei ATCC 33500]MDX5987441.1 hypothetical protein [Haloferax mediterranei ATCC 33500]QCQ73943.1 hypothetical protein E6P09_01085 [Haloferax mediterranei ATCC 33500]
MASDLEATVNGLFGKDELNRPVLTPALVFTLTLISITVGIYAGLTFAPDGGLGLLSSIAGILLGGAVIAPVCILLLYFE